MNNISKLTEHQKQIADNIAIVSGFMDFESYNVVKTTAGTKLIKFVTKLNEDEFPTN